MDYSHYRYHLCMCVRVLHLLQGEAPAQAACASTHSMHAVLGWCVSALQCQLHLGCAQSWMQQWEQQRQQQQQDQQQQQQRRRRQQQQQQQQQHCSTESESEALHEAQLSLEAAAAAIRVRQGTGDTLGAQAVQDQQQGQQQRRKQQPQPLTADGHRAGNKCAWPVQEAELLLLRAACLEWGDGIGGGGGEACGAVRDGAGVEVQDEAHSVLPLLRIVGVHREYGKLGGLQEQFSQVGGWLWCVQAHEPVTRVGPKSVSAPCLHST